MTTAIEWAEETWNPLAGCSVVSPGCAHCYAMREAGGWLSRLPKFRGLTLGSKAGPVWTGEVRLWDPALDQPLRWKKPRMIFVNSMSDLFHQSVPSGWIVQILSVMRDAPQHVYQILTKRAGRMKEFMTWWAIQHAERPPSNWWFGVSVEDQRRSDERWRHLAETPAAVRWISYEPALGPVDFNAMPGGNKDWLGRLHWVVCGGESGPHARPMHPAWARSIRDQCQAARVPFFFKQWGEWAPHQVSPVGLQPTDLIRGGDLGGDVSAGRVTIVHPTGQSEDLRPLAANTSIAGSRLMVRAGKKRAGRLLDGREWNEYPTPAAHA